MAKTKFARSSCSYHETMQNMMVLESCRRNVHQTARSFVGKEPENKGKPFLRLQGETCFLPWLFFPLCTCLISASRSCAHWRNDNVSQTVKWLEWLHLGRASSSCKNFNKPIRHSITMFVWMEGLTSVSWRFETCVGSVWLQTHATTSGTVTVWHTTFTYIARRTMVDLNKA